MASAAKAPKITTPAPQAIPLKKKSTPKLAIVTNQPKIDASLKQAATALDSARSATLICDLNWNIVYRNKRSQELLEFMEPNLHAWNTSWRSFSAKNILGTNLEFLFTDEPQEFRTASDPRNHPYNGIVRTGPCTCDIQITSITDGTGKVSGYAVDWERITDKLAQEKQIAISTSTLDGAAVNVMVVEPDMKLVYMNKKSAATLKSIEDDLKLAYGPSFRAEDLMGRCIDDFHKNPQYQRDLLKKESIFPHQANIKIGPLTLALNVNQVKDKSGKTIAYSAEWADVTAELANQAKAAQLMTVLDNSIANTMLCDLNWTVLYSNKKSNEILEFMEPNLHRHDARWHSFRAKEVVGKSLDWLFTDEPEEFRKASDPRNHPYRKNIKTGPCTCDVNVTSTTDAQGNLTGYAIYWERITERLIMEAKVAEQVKEGEYLANKIEEMMGVTLSIASGDLTQRIKIDRDDAIGHLGEAFNNMALNLLDMAKAAEKIAGGDLTVQVKPQSDKDILGNAFATMIDSLSELIAETSQTADGIARASNEVSIGNDDLAQRTEEQAASLEETASSMEEMTSTVKQNADNARQANQLALQAKEAAEKGGAVVGNAVSTMEEINKASKRIADIISVIDEIAFQTNLLALNAAVEAARVGEQGRGFAVVAGEVRNLAGRSATAAKEIKSLVQDSVQKVQDGSGLVNQSGQQLVEIVQSVKKVADIIAEISAAAQEQAEGIEQVNKAIMQMDQITQQNAALVEEASATSQSMNTQAQGLQELVGRFQLDESKVKVASTRVEPAPARKPVARVAATTTKVRSVRTSAPDEFEEF